MAEAHERPFFDRFERFFDTSATGTRGRSGARSQRLALRYRPIIEANRSVFAEARVLDIASHDGRWSLAAIDAGARHVLGVEGRNLTVADARATFDHYGIDPQRYEFLCADIFDVISAFDPGRFDVVLCLGFLYHTIRHCDLFREFHRLRPRHIILDTEIVPGDEPYVWFREEDPLLEGSILPALDGLANSIVGIPSLGFIQSMSRHFGYGMRSLDWHVMGIEDWTGVEDYRSGQRMTFLLERLA